MFVPISGWTADRFGARRVFSAAIVVFVLGSIGCGISNSLSMLVVSRIVQGMGGAMMVPVGRLVLLKTVPRSEIVRAMSYVSLPALLGPVTGPLLGGLHRHVRVVALDLFINIPIGIIGLVLINLFIEDFRETGARPFDIRGFVLTGIGLASLAFGFETIGRGAVPAAVTVGLLTAGTICMIFYVRHAKRAEFPVIDLTLMRIPTYAAATIGGFLFRMGMGALPFLLPMMLQIGFGLSALRSGLLTFASAAGAMTMKLGVVNDHPRFRARCVIAQCGDQRRISLFGLRVLPTRDAASRDLSGAACWRVFPLAADDEHQLALLRRRAAGDVEPCHQSHQHVPAIVASRWGRHRGVAALRVPRAARRGAADAARLLARLCRGRLHRHDVGAVFSQDVA